MDQPLLRPIRSTRPYQEIGAEALAQLLAARVSDTDWDAAADEFVHRYQDGVLRCVASAMRGYERDAQDDVAVEAVEHIIQNIGKYRSEGHGSFDGWYKKVAINFAHSRRDALETEPSFLAILSESIEPSASNERLIAMQESPSPATFSQTPERLLMSRVWDATPQNSKDLFIWQIREGLSDRQIAALLHIPEERVPNRRNKAKVAMMKRYEAERAKLAGARPADK